MLTATQKRIYFRVTVILLLVLFLFYFLFLREYNAYKSSLHSKDLSKIDAYLVNFPNGRYKKEIEAVLEKEAFARVVSDSSSKSIDNYYVYCSGGKHMEEVLFIDLYKSHSVKKAKDFLSGYPNSKYRNKVEDKIDQLWANEIVLYEKRVLAAQTGVNLRSVNFFRNLLNYMKENKLTTFFIRFSKNTKIKDFKEYTKEARDFCKLVYEMDKNNVSVVGYAVPTESNVYSVRSNFSEEGILDLEKKTGNEVVNSFQSIFSDGFFNFNIIYSDSPEKIPDNSIVIDLKYNIENEEENIFGMAIPYLWQYTESSSDLSNLKRFKGHFPGLKVEFKISIRNIGNNDVFAFSEKGDPGSQIQGFDNYNEAYKIMVGNIFADFIRKVSSKLGFYSKKDGFSN